MQEVGVGVPTDACRPLYWEVAAFVPIATSEMAVEDDGRHLVSRLQYF